MKNKTYIWISFIVLVFGILVVPKIVNRIKNGQIVKTNRLDSEQAATNENLVKIGEAPTFELINQDNKTISDATYKGKVYVVEFFFTSCPTICPKMNQNMLRIEKQFLHHPNFGIAAISIDPETDTPSVLKKYAKLLGVTSTNWNFLTGNKTTIYDLANKKFNVYVGQNNNVNGGFEHSGLMALIDKNGNIRCRKDAYGNPIMYYDGLDKNGIKAIQEDITSLLKE